MLFDLFVSCFSFFSNFLLFVLLSFYIPFVSQYIIIKSILCTARLWCQSEQLYLVGNCSGGLRPFTVSALPSLRGFATVGLSGLLAINNVENKSLIVLAISDNTRICIIIFEGYSNEKACFTLACNSAWRLCI